MHAALIVNDDGTYRDTKPGQVFRFLDEQMGWVEEAGEGFDASPWIWNSRLEKANGTRAIGTRVSEMRKRLPPAVNGRMIPGQGDLYVASKGCPDRLERYIVQTDRLPIGGDGPVDWHTRLIRRMPQAVAAVEQLALGEA